MSGDEEPIWSPTSTNTNEDDSNPPPATSGMPITWEYQTIEALVRDLRENEESYTFLLANFGGRVVGVNKWKFDVLSGAKKPSEVMSKSSEALLLLLLLNYWKAWEAQTHQSQQSEESSSASGSVSSISTASVTLYTRKNNNSTKDGWSGDGIRHFEALMSKVEEDRNSIHGKEFETKFQQMMKDQQTERDSRKRRRTSTSAGEQLTSIRNELSDASFSSEDDD